MEPVNACVDEPSVMDYTYEPVFGSDSILPPSSCWPLATIQDQGAEFVTRMACTRFGLTHVINAQNEYVASVVNEEFVMLPAKPVWLRYLEVNPGAESEGATLQSAMDQFLKEGLITGYMQCLLVDDMKSALSMGRLIYTGSRNGDWSSVSRDKTYRLRTDGRVVGHAFCIIGYDARGWIAVNSYGPDDGLFTIPYDLTETLFTRYAIIDATDDEAITTYRKRTMDAINIKEAKEAYEAKLWNGERPTEPVTREECAAMVMRAMKKENPA